DNKSIACWIGDVGGAFYPQAAHISIVPVTTGGQTHQFRPDFAAAAFPVWMPDGSLLFLGRKTASDDSIDWWVADENGHEHATGAFAALKQRNVERVSGSFWLRPEAWLESRGAALFSAKRGDAINVWSLGISPSGRMTTEPRLITLGPGVDVRPSASVEADRE